MSTSVQDLIRKHDKELLDHPDVQGAVAELIDLIRAGYPTADFHVGIGHDSLGVYITAIVDVEETDEVDNLYFDRMVELQVEARIPVYVTIESPRECWMGDDVPAAKTTGMLAG